MIAVVKQDHSHGTRNPAGRRVSATTRRDLLSNLLLLGGLWVAYSVVRSITGGDLATATENATAIIDLQRSFGLPSEADLQAAVLGHTTLIKLSNIYYLVGHFPITIGLLAWTWRMHRDKFARIRNALVAATAVGLIVHVSFPLLPPRMMSGFVDTAQTIGPDPYALAVSGSANQLAAMPSLHVGWALLVAASVIWIGTSRARWLVVAHPIATLLVVVVTANHYWADALVAAVIVAGAWTFASRSRPLRSRPPGPDREVRSAVKPRESVLV